MLASVALTQLSTIRGLHCAPAKIRGVDYRCRRYRVKQRALVKRYGAKCGLSRPTKAHSCMLWLRAVPTPELPWYALGAGSRRESLDRDTAACRRCDRAGRAMAPDKARHAQHARPRRRKLQRSGGHCDPAAAAAPNAFAAQSIHKDFPDSFGEALHGGGALLGGKLQRSFSGESSRCSMLVTILALRASAKDSPPTTIWTSTVGRAACLRLRAGLQQRVKAARESSVETRQRALALLASIIQRHLDGTPAGQLPRWHVVLYRSMLVPWLMMPL